MKLTGPPKPQPDRLDMPEAPFPEQGKPAHVKDMGRAAEAGEIAAAPRRRRIFVLRPAVNSQIRPLRQRLLKRFAAACPG